MSTKKDDETKTILKNLLILIILFYLFQYIGGIFFQLVSDLLLTFLQYV
jgi:hypothetical protein